MFFMGSTPVASEQLDADVALGIALDINQQRIERRGATIEVVIQGTVVGNQS